VLQLQVPLGELKAKVASLIIEADYMSPLLFFEQNSI
jgi:hypothetical protein